MTEQGEPLEPHSKPSPMPRTSVRCAGFVLFPYLARTTASAAFPNPEGKRPPYVVTVGKNPQEGLRLLRFRSHGLPCGQAQMPLKVLRAEAA